mmetsp:Transcript_8390/g.10967  ORF Transcript_8390/g.10967 Transcript_8390/m.10967 type:complete len:319 (-) Transcript_8390:421-1377(-)
MGVLIHAVGEQAALVKAHVAGRRTNQTGDRVFLHVLRHVKAQQFHTERVGQLFGDLSFTHTGWTGEEVVADGFLRLTQTGTGQFDCRAKRFDGFVLTKHHALEGFFQILEHFGIIFGDAFGRDARNFGHDSLDFFHTNGLAALGGSHEMLSGARLVDHVDGFVRQFAVIDVACRQFHGGFDRIGGVFHAVMFFKVLFEASKNFDAVRYIGLVHVDFLETTGQSTVFLKVLTEFFVGGGTHGAQLAPLQGRFQQVGGIHRAARSSASTDNGVDFIDEQHRVWVLFQLGHDSFQAFLKITAIPGACQQSAHVEGVDGRFA